MELYSFYFFEIFFPTQHKALTSTQIVAHISRLFFFTDEQ